jgi:hypothetical protein
MAGSAGNRGDWVGGQEDTADGAEWEGVAGAREAEVEAEPVPH